jgi:4-amino-4-deoxy-L-arabinose transferase-like glycosyltransferase
LAAGLGVLAKGPVGLICPGLVVLGYLVVSRRVAGLRWKYLVAAAGACILVAAPWFALLAIRGEGSFLHEVLFRQNVTRFLAPWDHAEPWWYFAKYLWIDMAPWAFLLPLAVGLPGRDPDQRKLDRLAWVWIATIVVFFSLSASKRSPYILPVAPAVAMLAAAPIERLISGTLDRTRRATISGMLAVAAGLFIALAVYLVGWVIDSYPAVETVARSLALLTAVGGVAVLAGVLLQRRWPVVGPAAFAATIISVYLLAATWALPAANAYKSAKPFCSKLQALVQADDPLRSYRFWRWRASYTYYTDRSIENIESPAELEQFWGQDGQVFLLVERGRLEEVRSVLGDAKQLIHDRIGSNEIYLLTNH